VSTDAGSVYLFHGNCDGTVGEFPSVQFYGAGEAGAGLGIADVNGDGHLDVVISGITFDVGPYALLLAILFQFFWATAMDT